MNDTLESFEAKGLHLVPFTPTTNSWQLVGRNGIVVSVRSKHGWEELGIAFPIPPKPERFGPEGISESDTRSWASLTIQAMTHPERIYFVKTCRAHVTAWDATDALGGASTNKTGGSFDAEGLHLRPFNLDTGSWQLVGKNMDVVISVRSKRDWEELGIVFPTPDTAKPERAGPKGISETNTRAWASLARHGAEAHPTRDQLIVTCRAFVAAWDAEDALGDILEAATPPDPKKPGVLPERSSLRGIIRGLMVSNDLGDVRDQIDCLCDLAGIARPEGGFVDGWTNNDFVSVAVRDGR